MNLTDNEIIKALEELHIKILCNNFAKIVNEKEILALVEVKDLINRQKAEIERLEEKSMYDDKLLNDRVQEAVNSVSKANQKYVDALEKAFNNKVVELKSAKCEAIKEFAERLKEKYKKDFNSTWRSVYNPIDNLVKEMVGE